MNYLAVLSGLLCGTALIHNIVAQAFLPAIYSQALTRRLFKFSGLVLVPLHEISHLTACVLFRHKVTKVCLYNFKSNDGTLGFISHSWNSRSVYQSVGCFFIAIAPLITATAFVSAIMNYANITLPSISSVQIEQLSIFELVTVSLECTIELVNWHFQDMSRAGLFMLTSLVCYHLVPSRTDFFNAAKGSAIVIALVSLLFLTITLLNIPIRLNSSVLVSILTTTTVAVMVGQLFIVALWVLAIIIKGYKHERTVVNTDR